MVSDDSKSSLRMFLPNKLHPKNTISPFGACEYDNMIARPMRRAAMIFQW